MDGKGPERRVGTSRPVNGKVEEVGPGPLYSGLDVALGDAILELGMGSTEVVLLRLDVAVGAECSRRKGAVVGVVPSDRETVRTGELFEVVLAGDGFGGVGGELREDEEMAGAVVSEEGATGVADFLGAVGVREAAMDGGVEVVGGDAVAGREVVGLEHHAVATETMVESVVDGLAVGGGQCRFGGGTVDVCFGGKACCALDVGDGDVAGDEIVGDGKVWTLMEGGLGV